VDPQNLVQEGGCLGHFSWLVGAPWQRGVLGPTLAFLTQMCPHQECWMHLPHLLMDAAARLSAEPFWKPTLKDLLFIAGNKLVGCPFTPSCG